MFEGIFQFTDVSWIEIVWKVEKTNTANMFVTSNMNTVEYKVNILPVLTFFDESIDRQEQLEIFNS